MGLLDDAIREHLDLKRRRGADPNEIERLEREALGPVRRERARTADEADYAGSAIDDTPGFAAQATLDAPDGSELDDLQATHDLPNGFDAAATTHLGIPTGHADLETEVHEPALDAEFPDELAQESEEESTPRRRGILRRRAVTQEREQADAEREAFLQGLKEQAAPDAQTGPPVPEAELPAHEEAPTREPPHLEFDPLPPRPQFTPAEPAPEPESQAADEPAAGDELQAAREHLQETAEHDVPAEFAAQDRDETVSEEQSPVADEDVLEETPEFLQDAPEHDRLWFEQKPPKDFDFDG